MCEAESQPEDTEYAENDSEVQVMSTDYTDSSSESDSSSTSDSSSSSDSQTVEAAVTEQPAATTTDSSSSETQDTSSDAGQYSDAYLLACLVSMEAGYESYEGQLAVANVVLNRVNSGKWGSSISSVIYAPNQFPCATGSVMQGYLQNGPLSTAQQAANDALAGNNNIGSFMSFLNVNYIDTDSLSDYQIIGNHCFY
jgi:spore germination cell wall hydrolase CwlJ-like protein